MTVRINWPETRIHGMLAVLAPPIPGDPEPSSLAPRLYRFVESRGCHHVGDGVWLSASNVELAGQTNPLATIPASLGPQEGGVLVSGAASHQ